MNPENAIGIDHNCHLRSGVRGRSRKQGSGHDRDAEDRAGSGYPPPGSAGRALGGRLRFQIRAGIAARKAYRTAMFVRDCHDQVRNRQFRRSNRQDRDRVRRLLLRRLVRNWIAGGGQARDCRGRFWGRAATGSAGLRVRVPVSISSASSRCATGPDRVMRDTWQLR